LQQNDVVLEMTPFEWGGARHGMLLWKTEVSTFGSPSLFCNTNPLKNISSREKMRMGDKKKFSEQGLLETKAPPFQCDFQAW